VGAGVAGLWEIYQITGLAKRRAAVQRDHLQRPRPERARLPVRGQAACPLPGVG